MQGNQRTSPRARLNPRNRAHSVTLFGRAGFSTLCWLAVILASCRAGAQDAARFQYITTAHQLGPVGYRDPLGVLSPDGERLAYSVAHHLYLEGGPVTELPAPRNIIRHLAWLPDSRTLGVDGGEGGTRWWLYDTANGKREPLWPNKPVLEGKIVSSGAPLTTTITAIEQLAWSADGRTIAGVVHTREGTQLWSLDSNGDNGHVVVSPASLSFPAWAPDGRLACLSLADGRQVLTLPCGGKPVRADGQEAYGPVAFSPNGKTIYYSAPNAEGILDLWSGSATGEGRPIRLTQFTRDTYAPSVGRDGNPLFKRQEYRTFVASVPSDGGALTPLTTFQSMTPSWNPSGDSIALTYGKWRRVTDDLNYPDILQDIGSISLSGHLPASAPDRVVMASPSEDQSLCWSPNAKWIVLHSHKDKSDDLWIQPADGSAKPTLLTHFGRGAETDWPRWSRDGRWIVVASYGLTESPRRHVLYLIGVDQLSGAVTQPVRQIDLDGFPDDITHAEWAPDSEHIVFQAYRYPDQQAFCSVPRSGGRPACFYNFTSEQRTSGFGLSPDGKSVAYVAPARDGYMQLYRLPFGGGEPKQLTFDPSNKTQPSYSPDGKTVAFVVWTYEVQFWVQKPG